MEVSFSSPEARIPVNVSSTSIKIEPRRAQNVVQIPELGSLPDVNQRRGSFDRPMNPSIKPLKEPSTQHLTEAGIGRTFVKIRSEEGIINHRGEVINSAQNVYRATEAGRRRAEDVNKAPPY